MATKSEIVSLVFIACSMVLAAWAWYRARPGSGERNLLPMLLLLSISMLVGLLPRVLWPDAARVKIGGSIASIVLTVIATLIGARRLSRAGRRT